MHKTELIVALDSPDLKGAERLLDRLEGQVKFFKVGSVLFTAAGPAAVELAQKRGAKVFLDLKFHDIPNTVKGALKSAAAMGVYSASLHLSGGPEMIRACAELEKRPKLWGITVLTSFDEHSFFRAGYRYGIAKSVKNLAAMGLDCGLDGIVCSPLEAADLRAAHGAGIKLITPGIRPAARGDDQKRAVTPAAARAAGADFIVVGRPIAEAEDPAAAAAAILKELA